MIGKQTSLKAIVHIGTEKTGTSSIQLFLRRNRKALEARGYHFLQSAGKTNNWALPAYCTQESRFDDFDRFPEVETGMPLEEFRKDFIGRFEAELRALARNVHTVVMSSEHFHSRLRTDGEMTSIRELLSQHFDDIKIICYIREQAETCASWYSTSMKSGSTLSFHNFVRRCRPESYYFNYSEMLANWEKHFGFPAMNVALFEPGKFLNGSLLDDFTARLDPALVGQLNTSIHTVNESLTPMGQALARALNIALPVADDDPSINALRNECKDIIARHQTGKGLRIDYPRRISIYESFRDSNEQVREKYFPEEDTLFSPPAEGPAQRSEFGPEFLGIVNEMFGALERSPRWPPEPDGYTRFWSAITTSVQDIIHVDDAVRQGGSEVVLIEEDARALRRAASVAEWDDLPGAKRVLSVAHAAFPELRGIRAKLKEYDDRLEARQDLPPTQRFILTYHGDAGDDYPEDEKVAIHERFAKWALALDVPAGFDRVIPLAEKAYRSTAEGIEESLEPYIRGFTLFRAASFEEAVEIARTCPFIESEGQYVELYRLEGL